MLVDLYYGDETQISMTLCVLYDWRFKEEKVGMPTSKKGKIDYFGMISQKNEYAWTATSSVINAEFIIEQMEKFSFCMNKPTMIVLDNAKAHTAAGIKERLAI